MNVSAFSLLGAWMKQPLPLKVRLSKKMNWMKAMSKLLHQAPCGPLNLASLHCAQGLTCGMVFAMELACLATANEEGLKRMPFHCQYPRPIVWVCLSLLGLSLFAILVPFQSILDERKASWMHGPLPSSVGCWSFALLPMCEAMGHSSGPRVQSLKSSATRCPNERLAKNDQLCARVLLLRAMESNLSHAAIEPHVSMRTPMLLHEAGGKATPKIARCSIWNRSSQHFLREFRAQIHSANSSHPYYCSELDLFRQCLFPCSFSLP